MAVLVYQRRQHVISLFVWPAGREDLRVATDAPQGYHVVVWTRSGMTRCAVSDLNVTELREFARLEQRADSVAAR